MTFVACLITAKAKLELSITQLENPYLMYPLSLNGGMNYLASFCFEALLVAAKYSSIRPKTYANKHISYSSIKILKPVSWNAGFLS